MIHGIVLHRMQGFSDCRFSGHPLARRKSRIAFLVLLPLLVLVACSPSGDDECVVWEPVTLGVGTDGSAVYGFEYTYDDLLDAGLGVWQGEYLGGDGIEAFTFVLDVHLDPVLNPAPEMQYNTCVPPSAGCQAFPDNIYKNLHVDGFLEADVPAFSLLDGAGYLGVDGYTLTCEMSLESPETCGCVQVSLQDASGRRVHVIIGADGHLFLRGSMTSDTWIEALGTRAL